MDSSIWVAIISAIVTILTVSLQLAANNKATLAALEMSQKETDAKLEKTQAVFEAHVTEQIKQLSDRVEKHNTVIERTYALERQMDLNGAEIKRHSERIKILEGKGA